MGRRNLPRKKKKKILQFSWRIQLFPINVEIISSTILLQIFMTPYGTTDVEGKGQQKRLHFQQLPCYLLSYCRCSQCIYFTYHPVLSHTAKMSVWIINVITSVPIISTIFIYESKINKQDNRRKKSGRKQLDRNCSSSLSGISDQESISHKATLGPQYKTFPFLSETDSSDCYQGEKSHKKQKNRSIQ